MNNHDQIQDLAKCRMLMSYVVAWLLNQWQLSSQMGHRLDNHHMHSLGFWSDRQCASSDHHYNWCLDNMYLLDIHGNPIGLKICRCGNGTDYLLVDAHVMHPYQLPLRLLQRSIQILLEQHPWLGHCRLVMLLLLTDLLLQHRLPLCQYHLVILLIVVPL